MSLTLLGSAPYSCPSSSSWHQAAAQGMSLPSDLPPLFSWTLLFLPTSAPEMLGSCARDFPAPSSVPPSALALPHPYSITMSNLPLYSACQTLADHSKDPLGVGLMGAHAAVLLAGRGCSLCLTPLAFLISHSSQRCLHTTWETRSLSRLILLDKQCSLPLL